MSFITTNPYGSSPTSAAMLVNVPELQNVLTSAAGTSTSALNDLLNYVNTTNASASVNTIGAYSGTSITVKDSLNLSNGATIQYLGQNILTSNAINGTTSYLSFLVNSVEGARLTSNALGLQTITPTTTLDVNGSATVRKTLYVSSFGTAPTGGVGDIYADGDIYARGVLLTSDPALKRNIQPYAARETLPTPVKFTWISTGAEDIGVLADEVERIEPLCMQRTPAGTMTVNYPKLIVLLLAEVKALKAEVQELKSKVQ